MAIHCTLSEQRNLTKKQKLDKEVERLNQILDCINEELKHEIDRGNDLCVIIYKLVHGHDTNGIPLEMHEIARIAQITKNIER